MRQVARFSILMGVISITLLVSGTIAAAQAAGGRPTDSTARPHQEPCWQVAGISKPAMEQRRMIAERTRSEVQSVCADTSLTLAQKHQKIRELREQAKVQEERLVSPEQLQALHTCQTSRGHSTGGIRMSGGGHGSGPCAELSKNSAPMSGPNKKPQPESEPQN